MFKKICCKCHPSQRDKLEGQVGIDKSEDRFASNWAYGRVKSAGRKVGKLEIRQGMRWMVGHS